MTFLYLHVFGAYTPTAAITVAPTPVLCNPRPSMRSPCSALSYPVLSAEQSRAHALPDPEERCVCDGPVSAQGLMSQSTGETAHESCAHAKGFCLGKGKQFQTSLPSC